MPFFFFMSGVFFSYSKSFMPFLLSKADVFLKPYFFVLTLLYVFNVIAYGDGAKLTVWGILYGNASTITWAPMWFLTHLFVLYLFSYVVFVFFRFKQLNLTVGCLLLLATFSVGMFFFDLFWLYPISFGGEVFLMPGLPFSSDMLLVTAPFFILGGLLRYYIVDFTPDLKVFFVSGFLFVVLCLFADADIEWTSRSIDGPFYMLLGALSGIYIMLSFAFWISRFRFLSGIPLLLGRSSLFILIFHGFFLYRLTPLFDRLLSAYVGGFGVIILVLLFSLVVPMVIRWVVINSNYLSLFFLPVKNNKLFSKRQAV